jgi:surfactin synthase thioesterase subunit
MSIPEAVFKNWFPAAARSTRGPAVTPSLRLLCFHNAGSAENIYTQPSVVNRKRVPNELMAWANEKNAEVLAIQLPGREARRGEPVLTTCKAVATALLPVVTPLIADTRYAIVAHSVGTWNCYELLRLLQSQGLPLPEHVFFSCFPSPDIALASRPWTPNSQLPGRAEFEEECRGWDVNEVVFSDAMWAIYEELMRGDFTCFDQYEHSHGGSAALQDVALTTFWAARDRKVKEDMVRGWGRFFGGGELVCLRVEGHHLFPYDPPAKSEWFAQITRRLTDLLSSAPKPAAVAAAASSLDPYAVRWSLNVRAWEPSKEEWAFALGLLPPAEAEKVRPAGEAHLRPPCAGWSSGDSEG